MGGSKHDHKRSSHKTPRHDKEDDKPRDKANTTTEHNYGEITDEEILAMGLPLDFTSSKGKQVQKHPVEAARIGQIRKYQRVVGKKLTERQLKRVRERKLLKKIEES